ncbi:MAG: FixH family protein [Mesorhizobium sp.]|nr:FixH family protein [Mesorhizobium sp.]MBL8580446.1 FixH family protein [Mesorhizobium sp.]
MKSKLALRSAMLALASCIVAFQAAKAAQEDYEFQLVENEIKEGDGAIVAVRLLDKGTGAPVNNAVVFATRMDMAPDGMETMAAPVEALPSEKPGIYRFKTNLMMAGGWRFSIAAKVQGETETVERRLEFKAVQ